MYVYSLWGLPMRTYRSTTFSCAKQVPFLTIFNGRRVKNGVTWPRIDLIWGKKKGNDSSLL